MELLFPHHSAHADFERTVLSDKTLSDSLFPDIRDDAQALKEMEQSFAAMAQVKQEPMVS